MTLRPENQKHRDDEIEQGSKAQDESAVPALQDLAPRKIDPQNADQVKGGRILSLD